MEFLGYEPPQVTNDMISILFFSDQKRVRDERATDFKSLRRYYVPIR